MKILLVIFSLVYTLFAADAESAAMELDFHERYKTALAEAKEENKMLLLVVVQDPCPFCDKLVHNTLGDEDVKKALKGYVGVVLNKRAKDLPKAFQTSMTPMTFFIDPKKENSVWESLGYVKKAQFLDDIKEAKKMAK